MSQEKKFLIGKEWRSSPDKLSNLNPYTGKVIGEIYQGQVQDIEDAIVSAIEAFEVIKKLSSNKRSEILSGIADGIERKRNDIANIITEESAKPIKLSRAEVDRTVFTFKLGSEEAKRIYGETLPLDNDVRSEKKWGLTRRFPIGAISAISPFNFPINLIAHKLAPAIAAGNSVVLKPPPQAPQTALKLAEIVLKSGGIPGLFNVVPCSIENAKKLVIDERLKMLNFTGSPKVGWELKKHAGKKRVLLELGGNAGVIVDRSANLDVAIKRIAFGAYANSGQICIKVQRIYVHEELYDDFLLRFKDETRNIKVGDPFEDDTVVSALIDKEAAERVERWIEEAKAEGGKILVGGERKGNIIYPTLISNTHPGMNVECKEIFGPVATIHRFRDIQEAIDGVNDSLYGLQTGIFSNDFRNIFYAYELINVGSVIVNDIPTYRNDSMPYGGIKDSGLGREGVRYAMEEMTEIKFLAFNFI